MKFDEIHKLLENYYSVMEVSDSDKKKRVDLAEMLVDTFYYVLFSIKAQIKLTKSTGDSKEYIQSLKQRLLDDLDNIPVEEGYLDKMTEDVIETTFRHLEDDYYYSLERAVLIAENETNSIYNYVEWYEATESGKTHKSWVTMNDERVRETHIEVDHARIPINEMFHVGSDYMRYPHDYDNGSPENLINCRCSCIYD